MRCLVTGGAGFIGSNLVDALVQRGDEVTVIDNLSTGKRSNLEGALAGGARLEVADVREAEAVNAVFAAAAPQLVFHLAAQIDVRYSVDHPEGDAIANVVATIAVLEAARAAGAQRLINTSTGGGLYGDAELLPTPEEHPIRPLAPYGQSKYAAEGYCELYARLHGISTLSLRYGNVYGPDARLGRCRRRGPRQPCHAGPTRARLGAPGAAARRAADDSGRALVSR